MLEVTFQIHLNRYLSVHSSVQLFAVILYNTGILNTFHRSDNPYEVAVEIVLHTKAEKSLKRMIEQGFDEGPGLSKEIVLREGDHLTLDFRANIKCSDDQANLDVMFHSQMNNRLTFEMSEVDKFLQKSYHVYRGFVMLCKKEETVCLMPPKKVI